MKIRNKNIVILTILILMLVPLFTFLLFSYLNSINTTQSFYPSIKKTLKLEWEKSWEDENINLKYSKIVSDDSGNLYFANCYSGFDDYYDRGILIEKFDLYGNLLWYKTFVNVQWMAGYDIAIDRIGNFIITGCIMDYKTNNSNVLLLKYDPDGDLLWNITLGSFDRVFVDEIVLDDSGNIFLLGNSISPLGEDGIFLLKYDLLGNLLWNKTLVNVQWMPDYNMVAIDRLGNLFMTRVLFSYEMPLKSNNTYPQISVLKFDSDGNILCNTSWDLLNCYNGSIWYSGSNFIIDDLGNIFLLGSNWNGIKYDIILTKYDSFGNSLWNRTLGDDLNEKSSKLAVDDSRNVFFTGSIWSDKKDRFDLIILKYDSSGNLLWERTWVGYVEEYGDSVNEYAEEIAVNNVGNVFILGNSSNPNVKDEVFLLKFHVVPGNPTFLLILLVILILILSGSVISIIYLVIIIRKGSKNLKFDYSYKFNIVHLKLVDPTRCPNCQLTLSEADKQQGECSVCNCIFFK